MALTPQEVAFVQASFGKMTAGSWTTVAEEFWVRAFKKYPDIKAALYGAFGDDPALIRGTPQFNAPVANFRGGFTALVNNLGDGELLGILVHKLAKNHVRRGLDPKRFVELFDEFMLIMSEDPANNKPTLNAWTKAFGVIASLMESCMAEIRAEQSA